MFKGATRQTQMFQDFSLENRILEPTQISMKKAAQAYAQTRQQGHPLDDIDLLIAGIALEHNLSLVTNNVKHFSFIQGLKIINWSQEVE